MKRCAYLVMDDPGDYVTDDGVSFDAMAELGWQVDCVPWRDPATDWNSYDAVYICTPWDYQADPAAFIGVLERIEGAEPELVEILNLEVQVRIIVGYALRDEQL